MLKRSGTWLISCLLLGHLALGCGQSQVPPDNRAPTEPPTVAKSRKPDRPRAVQPQTKHTGRTTAAESGPPAAEASPSDPEAVNKSSGEPLAAASRLEPRPKSQPADLRHQPVDAMAHWVADLPRMEVDDRRAAAAGIRKLTGRRLTLYTDLPPAKEIDELPEVFDQAFPQWCQYFHVDPAEHADWRLTGFLMKDKTRFQHAGLLPDDLPPFQNGFARNHELWLYDQLSDYYRRHLLLHEGTHAFMNTILRACGPPWYMEGIAELFGTHRWLDGRLTMGYLPENRQEALRWGRIEMIQKAVAAGRAMGLNDVVAYSTSAHREVEPYAWCWAAATLLDRHPHYRERFRGLYRNVSKPDFNGQFFRTIGTDWDRLSEEWQVFVAGLEFGHDVAAAVLDFTPGKPLPPSGARVSVPAAASWQNTGWRLDGGGTYRLEASGRYQVADQPQIWWCEPGGVSIRYYQGRPLGILLAAVRPDRTRENGPSALLRPTAVGLGTTLTPKESGTLYLKINDSAAELHNNAGSLEVEITTQSQN
ncbi:MAG: hypothetical protein A2V70_02480 [Planctomycetes bacterium RBG_13_63_9]|nr:MAG: hypothetical protein A2V70_02480 [Planctomycetes bacterium RBG_13_63_9]